MYLVTTHRELEEKKISQLDVILVTGDTYIDSAYIGAAMIGRVLENAGYSVGIIAQPDTKNTEDISRLGQPRLFWGITSGSVDSMVANYTAQKKFRRQDDLTPGEVNNRRPDRAVLVYSNLVRQAFKVTAPIVLGGVEASLRRIAHYDFWNNKIRNPILFDAKADYLLYGMAEKAVLELAGALSQGQSAYHIKGLCYIAPKAPEDYLLLPSSEECKENKHSFTQCFRLFYDNQDPRTAKGLVQALGDRFLVHNPPQPSETQAEMDLFYGLPFTGQVHPHYQAMGKVRAMDTIAYSITSHRGCYGECRFCAIALHQGRRVRWRSEASIMAEARGFTEQPGFRGFISDIGGPTANMYGYECPKKIKTGACLDKSCLYPQVCASLPINHKPQLKLLEGVSRIPGVKKVFLASGLRYDLILADTKQGENYLKAILKNHTSGQLKLAPEHSEPEVLSAMGKPEIGQLDVFLKLFARSNPEGKEKKFLTYYFIAAYPGCSDKEMQKLKNYIKQKLKIRPEQIQIFMPTPCTWASVMYYTETDPFTGKALFVEKDPNKRQKQKDILHSNPVFHKEMREKNPKPKKITSHFTPVKRRNKK
ncbi:MAG: YgiQ family radical SAM protein [Spirochaetales bacterium]|nr:YgiQ family radical SAM protein [Spirochaetales bacterium]